MAKISGLLYLIVIVCGIFSEFFVRSTLVVLDNATLTAHNIIASEELFRVGFVTDLIAHSCYFLLAFMLYSILKPTHKHLANLFMLIVTIGVAILCLNMLNHFAALLLLSGANYLNVFSHEQLQALALLFLNFHKQGYLLAQLFYGTWLIPLGCAVYTSVYWPRILGILLIVGGISYSIDFFVEFLYPLNAPSITPFLLAPSVIAEFSFCFWLLFKGVTTPD